MKRLDKSGIDQAIDMAGGQAKLAELLGCSQQNVSFWKRRGYVPAERAVEVEQVSGVPREKLISPRIRRLLEAVAI